MNRSDDRKNQTGMVFLFIFFGLAAGISAAGYVAYDSYEQNFRAVVERQLSAIAELKIDQLVEYRKERLGDAYIFFKNPAFCSLVRQFFEKTNNVNAQRQLHTWLAKNQAPYSYNGMFLLDARGNVRMSVPEKTTPIASMIQNKALEVLRLGTITIQEFHRNEHDQRIYLTLLVPIADDTDPNRQIGVLLLRIDPEAYLYPFIQTWPVPSRTSETLIVRREGNDVLFLNELRFQKNTALNLRFPLSNEKLPAARAALGYSGVMEGVDYRGEAVIAALRSVPNSPWFLVARTDKSEVDEPLKGRLWLMILLVGALVMGSGAVVSVAWRHQRNSFYRNQYQLTKALQSSETRYRRLFESAKDGILILDAETGKILDVNPFLIQMSGYSQDQFIEKSLGEIGFLSDIVADQVKFSELQQKEYVRYEDLSFETTDGRKISVEFISNGFLVDGHRIVQCNIRDITERKLAEVERERLLAELQEALSNVKTLSGLIPICAWCKKVRDDQGFWNQVEAYVMHHSDATFTHGICPDCMKEKHPKTFEKLYGEQKS